MTLKVVVDYDRCHSNGQCAAVASAIFSIDADGYVQHSEEQPDERRRLAEHAARVPLVAQRLRAAEPGQAGPRDDDAISHPTSP